MRRVFSKAKKASTGLRLALPAQVDYQTIIQFISATNDKATTILSFWKSIPGVIRTATGTTAAGQKVILCNMTDGIVDDDVCLIQDALNPEIYEVIDIDTTNPNVSYTTKANLVNSYSANAKVYLFKAGGGVTASDFGIPVGIATVKEENNTAVYSADENQAILIEFDACTATCDFYVAGKITDNVDEVELNVTGMSLNSGTTSIVITTP